MRPGPPSKAPEGSVHQARAGRWNGMVSRSLGVRKWSHSASVWSLPGTAHFVSVGGHWLSKVPQEYPVLAVGVRGERGRLRGTGSARTVR